MRDVFDGDRSAMLAELRRLALDAGRHMLVATDEGVHRSVTNKGRVDLVTPVDLRVQALLVEAIERRFPGERIVAEEGDAAMSSLDEGEAAWYIDPIDGTTNFVYGHPFYCVSIARRDPRGSDIGVVFAPALDELFCAEAGRGATLEMPSRGRTPIRLRASECSSLDRALLATGFPYHRGATARLNLDLVGHALTRCRGIRRGGSAALDLCYVAAGRLDGYWELALQPWDVAAGVLVAREAGARVTDFVGRADVLFARRLCAAAPDLHDELLAMIRAVHRDPSRPPFGARPSDPIPLDGPLPTELEAGDAGHEG